MANALIKRSLNQQSILNPFWLRGTRNERLISKAAAASATLSETLVRDAYNPINIAKNCRPYKQNIYHNSPAGFVVREAKNEDAKELTRLWFSSSSLLLDLDSKTSRWWDEVWSVGIQAGPNVVKTFVAENKDNKVVAFSRWNVPQMQGGVRIDASLPDFPDEWGAELTEALWGNVARNREKIMGRRPHWRCEFLAVDPCHQEEGLASMLVDWGCRQADAAELEVYIDRYISNLPVWKKENVHFWDWDCIGAPSHPDARNLRLAAIVRPPTFTGASATYIRN
ncbi:hypothetical protein AOL_s00078g390 [Orbilia oligospora ATCC 24927]|uniref:N-acetyltransferase domain-containing protein n=1 Tax=Arthrobotrys oligospora (strain ATCC 24927 / CBS 115.81 / DSM 1491) TaxID=756982 RepID=G1XBU3_ARTOA|nr:hypothetical protein AOL_s00078g390 [Orbilia oligospora ATCC 24927]EGX49357.1 hypothetical protein AOL_s00078g390 [Orbilia oligospora ATCC 24927]